MASSFLDKNGLLYFYTKLKGVFVQKDGSKVLSTNDYTNEEKQKLAGIAEGADVSVNADWNATEGKAMILNKPVIPAGVQASSTSPKMDGVASVGSETAFARGDHVHPSDDTKANVDDVYSKTDIDGKGFLVADDIANKADKATSLSGYGIADAYTKTEIDGKGFLVANDITNKADKATSLSGYGITDAYTKSQVDSKLSSVYKPGGSLLFSELPTPSATNLGYVYSMEDEFTTDERFMASEAVTYPIGTNVVVVAIEVDSTTQYKFDVLAGFVDLSDYLQDTDFVAVTNEEIEAMFASN